MQFLFNVLSDIWNTLCTVGNFIKDGFEYAWAGITSIHTATQTLPTFLNIFPYGVLYTLISLFSIYITFRILRFITFQG